MTSVTVVISTCCTCNYLCSDVKWVVIHENYLGKQPTQKDKESWVRFLEKIGIKKGLVVEKVIVKVPKVCTYAYTLLCSQIEL